MSVSWGIGVSHMHRVSHRTPFLTKIKLLKSHLKDMGLDKQCHLMTMYKCMLFYSNSIIIQCLRTGFA